jgi:hypothetical protein
MLYNKVIVRKHVTKNMTTPFARRVIIVTVCVILCFMFLLTRRPGSSSPQSRPHCVGRTNTPLKFVETINDAKRVLEGTAWSVHFGSLLQLYRDCSLASDTNDIDFIVPYEEITVDLIAKFTQRGWTKLRDFGKMGTPGFETSFRHSNGVKVDLFGQASDIHSDWAPLWVNGKLKRCRYRHSSIETLRIDHNLEVNVRAPVEPILEQIYGLAWREKIRTKNWNWVNPRCL